MSCSPLTQQLLYRALRNKFEFQRDEALATMSVYFENPTGIGEHPQIVEDMAKKLEQLSGSEDALRNLQRHFKQHVL